MVAPVLKQAVVHLFLKKLTLYPEDLSNYPPVSNVLFFSKVTEQETAGQFKALLFGEHCLEPIQTICRPDYETVLVALGVALP